MFRRACEHILIHFNTNLFIYLFQICINGGCLPFRSDDLEFLVFIHPTLHLRVETKLKCGMCGHVQQIVGYYIPVGKCFKFKTTEYLNFIG